MFALSQSLGRTTENNVADRLGGLQWMACRFAIVWDMFGSLLVGMSVDEKGGSFLCSPLFATWGAHSSI